MLDKATNTTTNNPTSMHKKRSRSRRVAIQLVVSLCIALAINFVASEFFTTPKKVVLERKTHRVYQQYNILNEKIAVAESWLSDIRHRDHYVYRPLLGVDTLNIAAVYTDYNDSKYYRVMSEGNGGELMHQTWLQLDRLTRNIYYASRSLDETQELAEHKEEFSMVIPAIWPIDRTKLKYVSSLYGMRMHPKYGSWRMHEGVDLSSPKGTAVYATGNGVVSEAKWRPGYGQVIEINHGFGYKTRYAHLSKMFVIEGDSVTRGAVIGEVGNTGISSGAHLHYEVRYRNNTVNPIHYFNKDMTPEAYIELMEQLNSSTEK